jgi:large subunit ribosomal protein L25
MADIALVLEPRTERGSASARRLRTDGRVPGVVYGHGDDPIPVSVDARQLRVALQASALGASLFDLVLGGESHLAIVRELQRHPVRLGIAHVDFQVVNRDEVVPAEVPVVLVGEALQVTRNGGSVEQSLLSIHLHAKPADVPSSIEVDITDLEIGHTIRVADLKISAGVHLDAEADAAVVVAQVPRGAEIGESAEPAASEAPEQS